MKINNEDVFKDIKNYDDYFFNTILTDPPYQLGNSWYVDTDGLYKVKGKSKDFMNKWDGLGHEELDEFFKESFRVLKYGGYLLMFGIDRQLGPLHYYATKNGFDINQSLYWYFVSNFPKATDASKMIDKKLKKERKVVGKENPYNDGSKRKATGNVDKDNVEFLGKYELDGGMRDVTEPSSDLAKVFDGYKYSKAPLKQMLETICIFSKPTKNKSVIDDILEWSEDVDLLNYSPKVGKKERNMGCEDLEEKTISRMATKGGTSNIPSKGMERFETSGKNNHPTIKPINLIYEIAKLFKLPDIVEQKWYVPFSGTGSEIIGILKAGVDKENIYGCEVNEEYYNIGKKRIEWYEQNKP